jgi:hypothetical protein
MNETKTETAFRPARGAGIAVVEARARSVACFQWRYPSADIHQ